VYRRDVSLWSEHDLADRSAAPGNKTSYISALMRHSSHLLAFERSPARFKTLEEMIAKADCRNVRTRRADFTDSDPNDAEFANITRM
jgi:putative methyltransferase